MTVRYDFVVFLLVFIVYLNVKRGNWCTSSNSL